MFLEFGRKGKQKLISPFIVVFSWLK